MLLLLTEVENIIQVLKLELHQQVGGAGAVVRPVVENGQVIDAIVTNSGIGYSSVSTEVRAFSRGTEWFNLLQELEV